MMRLYWPAGEMVNAHEFAREFHLEFWRLTIRLFALDHLHAPNVKLRVRWIEFRAPAWLHVSRDRKTPLMRY